jgi:hypothetical protein
MISKTIQKRRDLKLKNVTCGTQPDTNVQKNMAKIKLQSFHSDNKKNNIKFLSNQLVKRIILKIIFS